MDNAINNSGDLLDHRYNSPVACRGTQLGEGHRQNSAVARNERFSLASGRQVRQDRDCKLLSYQAIAPLRGGFGVSGVSCFPAVTFQKFSRYRAAKTAGTQVFQD
jgi:hypothetical protein